MLLRVIWLYMNLFTNKMSIYLHCIQAFRGLLIDSNRSWQVFSVARVADEFFSVARVADKFFSVARVADEFFSAARVAADEWTERNQIVCRHLLWAFH